MGEVKRRLALELAIVLTITFGASGLRSAINLAVSLAQGPLANQTVTLNRQQAAWPLVDLALQLCSAAVLTGWGLLAWLLLGAKKRWPDRTDGKLGVLLAAGIGLPGLAFYLSALHLGLTKQVQVSEFDQPLYAILPLLVWAAANAYAEELVVVAYVIRRAQQLGASARLAVVLAALLRGSYHLYQGISAGPGNIIMGLVFGAVYLKTRRIWPLVIAHFLIDAVAFIGAPLVGPWLGLTS